MFFPSPQNPSTSARHYPWNSKPTFSHHLRHGIPCERCAFLGGIVCRESHGISRLEKHPTSEIREEWDDDFSMIIWYDIIYYYIYYYMWYPYIYIYGYDDMWYWYVIFSMFVSTPQKLKAQKNQQLLLLPRGWDSTCGERAAGGCLLEAVLQIPGEATARPWWHEALDGMNFGANYGAGFSEKPKMCHLTCHLPSIDIFWNTLNMDVFVV